MKLLIDLKNLNLRKYLPFLIPATVGYFYIVQTWQSRLSYPPSGLDPYPGIPLLPEPYEIPLYLLGYLVIPILALIVYWLWRYRLVRYLTAAAVVGGGIAAIPVLFSLNLPTPQFVIEYLNRRGIWHAVWLLFTKRIFIIRIAFAIAVLTFLISSWIRPKVAWVERLEQSSKLKKFVPYFFIILALILFHPNFPSEEGFVNYGISAAHETLRGKPILYETSTQYGLLNTYLVALVIQYILPLSYKSFSLLLMLMYFGFYVLLYKLLRVWLNSPFFALIGTWLGVIVGFFLLTDPYITAFHYLGQTVYRQGFYIIPALLIVYYMRNPRPLLREVILLTSAISLFWSYDNGAYINIATFLTLAYREQNFRGLAFLGLRQLGYITLVLGGINLINYLIFDKWPNWSIVLTNLELFTTGLGKIPLPKFGLYELYVLVYMSFLLWIIRSLLQKRKNIDLIVLFLTIYGIFSLIYYVGNSAWSYLNLTSLPMLLLLLYAFYRWRSERLVRAAFHGVLAFALIISLAKIPVVFAYRDYSEISLAKIEESEQLLYEDAQYLKANFRDTRIPLFHENMGKLLIMADKVNYFYVPFRGKIMTSFYDGFMILFKDQTQGLLEQVQAGWPEHVFITKQRDERITDFENFVKEYYYLEKSLNTLNIYKLK